MKSGRTEQSTTIRKQSNEARKLLRGLEAIREELGSMGEELIDLLKRRVGLRENREEQRKDEGTR
jgi:hypothetical protein